MLKIKKITSSDYKPGWTQWIDYEEQPTTIVDDIPTVISDPANPIITISDIKLEHKLTNTGNIVNYKLLQTLNSGETEVIYNINIDIDVLKTLPTYTNQSYFGISNSVYEYYKTNTATTTTPYEVKYSEFVNMYADNLIEKRKLTLMALNGNMLPIAFFVPSANSTVNDIHFIVDVEDPQSVHYPMYTIEFDIIGDVDVVDIDNDLTKLVSPITISPSKPSMNADDMVTLTLTTQDTSITEVYAEAVFGIIPKTRIALTNGVGNIKVSSLGLSTGDPVRIKFGYKYFTGVAEYTTTIA